MCAYLCVYFVPLHDANSEPFWQKFEMKIDYAVY